MNTSDRNDSVSHTVITKTKVRKKDDVKTNFTLPYSESEDGNHRVLIIGDSHTRDCASNVKENLNKNFSVCGYVKPGYDILTLTTFAKSVNQNLTKKNCDSIFFFVCYTNDVVKDNTKEELKHLKNFVMNNSHTNIILMHVPHRDDLANWSCINYVINSSNRKLEKLKKNQKHVTVLAADSHRELFTSHGLHMNTSDKETIAKQIVTTCITSFRKTKWPQSPSNGRINRVILIIIITHRFTQIIITRRILS
jgi:hypothetical protein